MAKIKCHQCQKEVKGGAKIQGFNMSEPTSTFVFCSEACKTKWEAAQKKK